MPRDAIATEAGLQVETIESFAGLWRIREEWSALWRRCPRATPFQTPEWLLAWWRTFGRGGLWTMVLRNTAQQMVGLAPLYLHTEQGVRTLRLVGAGVSDYLDALVEPEWESEATTAISGEIAAYPERWDVVELQQLPADSPLARCDILDGWTDECVSGEPCPVVTLGSADQPIDSLAGSLRLRDNVAADARRLTRSVGPIAIERATLDGFAARFTDLRELHTARWNDHGEAGVLADDGMATFLRSALHGLCKRGLLRLEVMRAGGAIVAAYCGFHHNAKAYYYLGGFNPAYRHFGVGNQLVAHAIAEAAGEGAVSFDFLRGQESYKYRWGAVDVPTFCRRLHRTQESTATATTTFVQPGVTPERPAARSAA